MALSANINTLSYRVFPNKKGTFYALEIDTKSVHLKYLTPVIKLEIFPVPPSQMSETHETRKKNN